MGKGGYIGGGTIIGPHTPEWFGQGDEEPEKEPEPKPKPKLKAKFERPSGPLTRNQRRKLAQARREAKEARKQSRPTVAKPKRELSAVDERRIAKLRLHIKGLEQLRDSYQKQIDSALTELNGVLKEYGLPLDRPGQK